MILTEKALTAINNTDTRLRLAIGLGFTETWVRELIAQNKPNGPLTTFKAMQVIRKETGLVDREILVDESVAA